MKPIFIATTTINKPSIALQKYAKLKNFKLVVALDKNSKTYNKNSRKKMA